MFLCCYYLCNRERFLFDALVDVLHTVRFFLLFFFSLPIFCQNYSAFFALNPMVKSKRCGNAWLSPESKIVKKAASQWCKKFISARKKLLITCKRPIRTFVQVETVLPTDY